MLKINNRRYIGSKSKLLDFINDSIIEFTDIGNEKFVFADLFAGTGVVSDYFSNKGHKVILNDNLYSNFIAYQTWFSSGEINQKKVQNIINMFNEINPKYLNTNYFSNIYGDKYFSINASKKIGHIRDEIELIKEDLTDREYYTLITSLVYATDKIANTVGHFEHYLKIKPVKDDLVLLLPTNLIKRESEIYNQDANELVDKIVADLIYIDPPYNARQYINFYHVLENLARWEKPTEFEGISMKFKRDELKSGYSQAKASGLMQDLVDKCNSRYILVSYNNTYNAKSGASNNKMSEEVLKDILNSKGKTIKIEIPHNHFNSGKTNFLNHKELLFICKVGER